ncbi:MAG: hypothetical protein C4547_00830 [Phycisphaerales bacterium]|nr:MAG: hypothetical protein C4547_00830 [Phycisphaerales bacterium]
MHPELWTIPGITTIKSYGFMLMVGFLSAVWFAMRRAMRVKANPDVVLNLAFIALIGGVGGARIMFVTHYWQEQFAGRSLLSILDLRLGGLEFLGGLLGAFIGIFAYLLIKRESIRVYLDILAPGAMWGLAFGRIGCFLNGCCFGGVCDAPWAVEFPYASNPYIWQWQNRQARVPAELIDTRGIVPTLVSASALNMPDLDRRRPQRELEDLEQEVAILKASGAAPEEVREAERKAAAARKSYEALRSEKRLDELEAAQKFPSRSHPQRGTSVSELQHLADHAGGVRVHPTQLYSSIHAFLLSALLSAVFYRRRRHGLVIGLLFLLYPIARATIEGIRVDNPHDSAGMTVSQFISVVMFLGAAAYLFVLYKFLPQRCPRAVPFVPPEPEPAKATPQPSRR